MSATVLTRLITPASKATFSTTSKALRASSPMEPMPVGPNSSSSWSWKNLSPKTRRNVLYGVGLGLVVDSLVVYHYYPAFFSGEGKKL